MDEIQLLKEWVAVLSFLLVGELISPVAEGIAAFIIGCSNIAKKVLYKASAKGTKDNTINITRCE